MVRQKVVHQRKPKEQEIPMLKRIWLGHLFLLILVSLTSFLAVNTVAYPGPFSCSRNTDSGLYSAHGLAPPVMDKTFVYDAKMASLTTAFANLSGDEDNGAILPTADTTNGGLYQNVAMNRFETAFSGDSEVAHPAVIVCESLAFYGHIGPQFADYNGYSLIAKSRSLMPEVIYIGDRSGGGTGEANFASVCDSFASFSDIGDPVHQTSRPAFQTLSATPEVVYLGDKSPAGDSDFLPKWGNKFAVVCGEDGC